MSLKHTRSLQTLQELPYYGVSDLISCHGQFNNTLSYDLPTKKYLEKLSSLNDLDLFTLNVRENINPDLNLINQHIHSNYYSPHSFNVLRNRLSSSSDDDFKFSLLHNNVRSLRRNLEDLQVHLLDELGHCFSIIGVSETKTTKTSLLDFNPSIAGYEFEYVPTPLAAGGVGMYIKSDLNYTVIEKSSEDAFQALWIEIHLSKRPNIICGIMYRQHNTPERFQEYFDETLEKFSTSNKSIFVMGDFNINLLGVETCNYAHNFLLSLQSFSLIPTIDKPKRVYKNTATLIDNILVNKLDAEIYSGNIVSDISDHYSQFCIFQKIKVIRKKGRKKMRDFSSFSENSFADELSQIDWDSVSGAQNDPDHSFTILYNKVNKLLDKHAPYKTLSQRRAKQMQKPWITRGLRKSIKVKNCLFSSGNKAQYKIYRNKILILSRLSKKLYYHNYFSQNVTNMKNTWAGINSLINNKRKDFKRISSIIHPDSRVPTNDRSEISNIFNNFFSSVGPNLASKLPSTIREFTDYMSGNFDKSFFFNPVVASEIETEILSIPLNKAHGLYSCPTRILRSVRHILSKPQSVSQGVYPSKLKHAKVIPVYKSEDETDPGNYRPISLLSNFNRIFEKVMFKRLKMFLDQNDILFRSQYGFRDKHSTQHAILDIVNTIQGNMDKKLYTCGIFIDLKKAFDTVNHSVLLSKLHHYGIRGVVNDWFSSYLCGRVQTTEVEMTVSAKATTPCGVPQGSMLGPLLFLIYINDIPNSSSKLSFYLFADDTNMRFSDNNLQSLATVNNELKNVCDWLTANKLTLNTKKSNFVIFRPRQKKLEYEVNLNVIDNNTNTLTSLECKEYVKYLGVLIDSHLSWKFHIDYVASKLSKIVGIIARLRHLVPFNTLLSIYQSLMFPYLTFGLSAWGQAAQLHLNKLLLLQKRAIRFMNFSKPRTHAVPLFISSKILPINMLYVHFNVRHL